MGAQLTGGNSYGPYAAMAAKHGGAGNAQMFNQQTAPMQYQQGLDQQGMTMQGIAGLMSAIAGAVQRHRDMAALYGRQEPHPAGQGQPFMGTPMQHDFSPRSPSGYGSPSAVQADQMNPAWFGMNQSPFVGSQPFGQPYRPPMPPALPYFGNYGGNQT